MFASTLNTIAFNLKNIPTLTSQQRGPYKSKPLRISIEVNPFNKSYNHVLRIKQQLNRIYQHRVELIRRDIDNIYNGNTQFCRDVLGYNSSQQMFDDCDKDQDDKLNEVQQMNIFTSLLKKLIEKKQQHIKNQNYNQFVSILNQIKSIEKQLPLIQMQIRNHILEEKKSTGLLRKKQKLQGFVNQFKNYQQKRFSQQKNQKINALKKKHSQEYQKLEEILQHKNQRYLYKARPSAALNQAKNMNLLQKLAPYKNQKKRQYQCEVLKTSIINTIDQQQIRINKTIEVQKKYEKIKLKKEQEEQQNLLNQKINRKYRKLLAKIDNRKQEIQKSEQVKLSETISKQKKQTNQRLDWITKAVKYYRQRKDSIAVAQIVTNHKDIHQHNNTIQKITNLNQNVNQSLNFSNFISKDAQFLRKSLNKSPILRSTTPQTDIFLNFKSRLDTYQDSPTNKGRRSLTSLYDQKLNLVDSHKKQ